MAAKTIQVARGTHAVTTGTDAAYDASGKVTLVFDATDYSRKEDAIADAKRAVQALEMANWP